MRSTLHRWLFSLSALCASLALQGELANHQALAAPKKAAVAAGKKYYWTLLGVFPKADVPADVAAYVKPLVEAQLAKALATNPQLTAALPDGADASKAAAFKKLLSKAKIAGAYSVSIDIAEASEEVVDIESKPGEKRLVVRLSVHLLSEVLPEKTIGFTADGTVSIKQEIGKKLRPKDRDFVWASAVEAAVNEAISTSLKDLSKPAAKK
jgi:hypothetical protein